MRVLEIWRYPVKSLQGERLDSALVGVEGIEGDRQWAIFDVATGFGLTGRREGALLHASARTVDGRVEVVLPDGSVAADDEARQIRVPGSIISAQGGAHAPLPRYRR